jgi:D-inositol-3-phosphate glycosyltransferase
MRTRVRRNEFILGTFGRFATSPPGRFYGARMANDGFLNALLRYGAARRVDLFVPPSDLAEARRFGRVSENGEYTHRVPLRVHKTLDVLRGLDRDGLAAWHDTFASGGLPFHLRRLMARRPYPVTLVHHTVSYPGMLATFFRLLTEDVRSFDALVCTTWSARAAIQRLFAHVADRLRESHGLDLAFKARLPVIPLGVNTHLFSPGARLETRQRLGIDEGTFVLLWLGRISAADKADLLPLLRVLRKLGDANPTRNLLLLVAGKGRDRDSENLADYATRLGVRQRLRLLPDVPEQDKPAIYASADVFVSPADNVQEMFGITPIEAMSCGVPQVVSDWNGYAESVVHGETGFRIPTYWSPCDGDIERASFVPGYDMLDHRLLAQSVAVDLELYCRRIQQLMDAPQLRQHMAHASRARAMGIYDWSKVIPQYDALWAALVEEARRAAPVQRKAPWDAPGYFDVFGGHATVILGPDTRVRISAEGKAVASGAEMLPAYYADGRTLSARLAAFVLGQVAVRGSRGATIETVLTSAGRRNPETLFRHLMWLLKHGLVDVTSLGSGRRAPHADELFDGGATRPGRGDGCAVLPRASANRRMGG